MAGFFKTLRCSSGYLVALGIVKNKLDVSSRSVLFVGGGSASPSLPLHEGVLSIQLLYLILQSLKAIYQYATLFSRRLEFYRVVFGNVRDRLILAQGPKVDFS